jgi:hypothetical protein
MAQYSTLNSTSSGLVIFGSGMFNKDKPGSGRSLTKAFIEFTSCCVVNRSSEMAIQPLDDQFLRALLIRPDRQGVIRAVDQLQIALPVCAWLPVPAVTADQQYRE